MKTSYKKAMIALGLMAAVLLFYKYSTVVEGLEPVNPHDPIIPITKRYIANVKKILDDKKKKIKNLIDKLEQESEPKLNSQDILKLNNLNTHIENIFKKYKENMLLHPSDLNFQILINEVSTITPSATPAESAEHLKTITETVTYIVQKLAFINQFKQGILGIKERSEPTPLPIVNP